MDLPWQLSCHLEQYPLFLMSLLLNVMETFITLAPSFRILTGTPSNEGLLLMLGQRNYFINNILLLHVL